MLLPPDSPSRTPDTGPSWRARERGLSLPSIRIDVDEHRVVDQAITALAADPGIFQRGGQLVHLIHPAALAPSHRPEPGIQGGPPAKLASVPLGAGRISLLSTPTLRERLTRCARFTKRVSDDKAVAVHPPPWLVLAVEKRGEWPGIRPLVGISDAPVLRRDGSVCQTPGYDAQTGVVYEPTGGRGFPAFPQQPTRQDARHALALLNDVIGDFMFEAPEHRSAWLAALLTLVGRYAIDGPTPLFAIDANVRGAGKGLLARVLGRIALGCELPASSYAHDVAEMRKLITAIALGGDRVVLLDNVEGPFGNAALDRALTTARWKDRVLGKSEQVDLPLNPVWLMTGNNIAVAADTARRIIHIRLDVLEERPEERTGFRHRDLIGWVARHRARLYVAALTVISGYLAAGEPDPGLPAFGSFEAWSGTVRQALVWSGMPDPCLTRNQLNESADTTTQMLARLLEALVAMDPGNRGIFVTQTLKKLYPKQPEREPEDPASRALKAAIEDVLGCKADQVPTSRQLGAKFSYFRGRVVGGLRLDRAREKCRDGVRWHIHRCGPRV